MTRASACGLKMVLGWARDGAAGVLSGLVATLGLQSSTATALMTASLSSIAG